MLKLLQLVSGIIIQLHQLEYKSCLDDSWLFCTKVTNLLNCLEASATPLELLLFSLPEWDMHLKQGTWLINNLLNVLVYSFAEHFNLLFAFWLALQVHQNTAQQKCSEILHTKISNKICKCILTKTWEQVLKLKHDRNWKSPTQNLV